jgi:hypothetical protein
MAENPNPGLARDWGKSGWFNVLQWQLSVLCTQSVNSPSPRKSVQKLLPPQNILPAALVITKNHHLSGQTCWRMWFWCVHDCSICKRAVHLQLWRGDVGSGPVWSSAGISGSNLQTCKSCKSHGVCSRNIIDQSKTNWLMTDYSNYVKELFYVILITYTMHHNPMKETHDKAHLLMFVYLRMHSLIAHFVACYPGPQEFHSWFWTSGEPLSTSGMQERLREGNFV